MIQEIDVPEGKVLFPIFVDAEHEQIAIDYYADKIPNELVEDGNGGIVEKYTENERVRMAIAQIHNRQMEKYQRKVAADAANIITNIVS